MMASPTDLEDFALGFALTEGLIRSQDEVREIEIVTHDHGTEARLWLGAAAQARAVERQRAMVGPVGCGLCGIDSLDKVHRTLPPLPQDTLRLTLAEICGAPELLQNLQPEHDRTRGCHAAGLLLPGNGIVLVREDVGRHNALDKLAGACLRGDTSRSGGAIVLTSRVSTEMVQKAVTMGASALVAVSTATDYALRLAEDAGLVLVTRVRGGGCEILAGAGRLAD